MRRRGLSVAVVWGRSGGTYDRAGDVLYLTNYYGNNSGQGYDNPYTHCRAFSAVILREGEEPELLIDDSWPRMDLIATGRVNWSRNPAMAVAGALRGTTGRVGLCGSDFFPMKYWNELKEATPAIEWIAVDDLVLLQEDILVAVALRLLEPGMVGQGVPAFFTESGRKALGLAPRGAVDDAGAAAMPAPNMPPPRPPTVAARPS